MHNFKARMHHGGTFKPAMRFNFDSCQSNTNMRQQLF